MGISRRPTLAQLSDIALILASVAVVAMGVDHFRKPAAAAVQQRPDPVRVSVNESVQIPGVDFSLTERTLVLVAHSKCGYCGKSMGFYKRISESSARKNAKVRLVVVGTEARESLTDYLAKNGVAVDDVVSVDSNSNPSGATPTLILVDRVSKVLSVWRGFQSSTGEAAVLKAIS